MLSPIKITIKASDYEKVISSDFWPNRVGVRLFKHFNSSNGSGNTTNNSQSWNPVRASNQPKQSGVAVNRRNSDSFLSYNLFNNFHAMGNNSVKTTSS